MIISVLNLKGGAGKTTLATNVAAKVSDNGLTTLLIDADRQRSAMQWYELRHKSDDRLFVNSMTEPLTLTKELMKIEEIYQTIVIDGAPNIEETTTIIASMSDQIVVPIQPSGFDLGATRQFLLTLRNLQLTFTQMRVLIVFNRINMRTSLAQAMIECIESFKDLPEFQDFHYAIAKTRIQNRIVYADAASTGETVWEKKDQKAQEEIQSQLVEIKEILEKPTEKVRP